MDEKNLHQEISAMHADLCSAVADPNRILIIYQLADSPRNVGQIASSLNLSPSTTSRHLKILKERHIVSAQRRGHNVLYRLIAPDIIEALDIFRAVLSDQLAHRASLINMEKDQ